MRRAILPLLIVATALAGAGPATADPVSSKGAQPLELTCDGTVYHVVIGSGGAAHDLDSTNVFVLKGITVADPTFGTYGFSTPGFTAERLTTCTGSFVNRLGEPAPFTAYVLVTPRSP